MYKYNSTVQMICQLHYFKAALLLAFYEILSSSGAFFTIHIRLSPSPDMLTMAAEEAVGKQTNKMKTGFPKSRSVAFGTSCVFDFYSIVCFFDPLLSLSGDMRTIFAKSLLYSQAEWHVMDETSTCPRRPRRELLPPVTLWGQIFSTNTYWTNKKFN